MKPTDLLHPDIAKVLEAAPVPTMTAEHLATLRARDYAVELSDAVQRVDHLVPGEPPVAVRVHRPREAAGALPCVLSIHGGGYVMGSNVMDDPLFDQLCPALNLVGVSVEYRLAPETPYPGPLEDCYRALSWTFEHAGELGIDRDRIGIRGISARGAGRCPRVAHA